MRFGAEVGNSISLLGLSLIPRRCIRHCRLCLRVWTISRFGGCVAITGFFAGSGGFRKLYRPLYLFPAERRTFFPADKTASFWPLPSESDTNGTPAVILELPL